MKQQKKNKTDICKRFAFPRKLQRFVENQFCNTKLYDIRNKLKAVLLPSAVASLHICVQLNSNWGVMLDTG
jgi:hypothetical protein